MSRPRAFTLVELLTVITVIAILLGLLFPAISIIKKKAKQTRTISTVQQVEAAIASYKMANGTYPELVNPDAVDTALGLATGVAKDYTSSAVFFDSAATPAPKEVTDSSLAAPVVEPPVPSTLTASPSPNAWVLSNLNLVYQLGGILDAAQVKKGLIRDDWGWPLCYRPAKCYPFKSGAAKWVDSDQPPNADTFQLWSTGADNKQDGGNNGDDLPNWTKDLARP